MGVTVYLFDSKMRVREVLARGVSELLHTEEEWLLEAKIPARVAAEPGEYLGFACVDGNFRLFEIDTAEDDSDAGTTAISATDAAAAELNAMIAPKTSMEGVGAAEVANAVLAGSGWALDTVTATDRTGYVDFYYKKVLACLEEIQTIYNARMVLRYLFDGTQITGKKVDLLARDAVFRGRVLQSASDASDVSISLTGSPRSVMYGLGKSTGTGNNPERLTFADVVWSKANGDPADKPAGQDWIADPDALEQYGRKADVYNDSDEEDAAALLQKTWEELQLRKVPTVEGTATAQDMEMVPGYEYKQVRIYDQVGVVDRRGKAFMTQVVGIERDYIRPWLTKFDLGDEKQEALQKKKSLARQVADAAEAARRAGGGARGANNGGKENKSLIVENMEQIRLHTINIGDMSNQIREAEIEIGNGQVRIAAAEKTMASQGERLRQAEIDVDATKASISLKADQTTVNALGERVSSAEINIDGAKAEINLKVSKDGVISSINQTPESVTINASKINLNGYVTASQLQAQLTDVKSALADYTVTDQLDAQSAHIHNNFYYANTSVSWLEQTVVTSVGLNTSSGSFWLDGKLKEFLTGATLTKSTKKISYLGT